MHKVFRENPQNGNLCFFKMLNVLIIEDCIGQTSLQKDRKYSFLISLVVIFAILA